MTTNHGPRGGEPLEPTSSPTPVVRVSGPGELLSILPHQLGFHPARSLVVAGVRDGRLGHVQRVDVPSREDCPAVIARMVDVLVREAITHVLVAVYEDIPGEGVEGLDAMVDACLGAGIDVLDEIIVRDRHFACHSLGAEWHEVPTVLQLAGGEHVAQTCPEPLATRHELVERVWGSEAADAPLREEVVGALMRLRAREKRPLPRLSSQPKRAAGVHFRRRCVQAWALVLDPDGPDVRDLEPDTLALAGAGLLDREMRDGIVAWLCPWTLPMDVFAPSVARPLQEVLGAVPALSPVEPGRCDRVLWRLVELGRIAAPEHAPSVRTVLASMAWHHGDGALAAIAVEAALADDPGLRLAQLMDGIIRHGVRTGQVSGHGPAGVLECREDPGASGLRCLELSGVVLPEEDDGFGAWDELEDPEELDDDWWGSAGWERGRPAG